MLEVLNNNYDSNGNAFTYQHHLMATKYIESMVDFLDRYTAANNIIVPNNITFPQPTTTGNTTYFTGDKRHQYLKAYAWAGLENTKAFIGIFGVEPANGYPTGSAGKMVKEIIHAEEHFNDPLPSYIPSRSLPKL